jgi:drug/metabolite transporter (DMT)-like permease
MAPSAASPRPAQVLGAFGSCVVVWGSTFLFIAIGNDTVPPTWGAALRLALAAAILFVVMAIRGLPLPKGVALKTCVLYGFFQFGLNFPLLYLGETAVPSGLAAVVFATIPLSTVFFARAFGLERLSAPRIVGALVALMGILVAFWSQLRAAVPPLALLELLGATWVACLGSVFLKRGPRQSPIVSNGVGSAVGCVACLAWSVALGESRALPTSWAAVFPIVYLAVAGSVGAFVLWAWLVNHWDISRASYIAVLIPIVALSLGALVRHERLEAATLLGAAIVLVGVGVGLRPAARAPQPLTSSSSRGSTG